MKKQLHTFFLFCFVYLKMSQSCAFDVQSGDFDDAQSRDKGQEVNSKSRKRGKSV